ncbi:MAG: class I SAM-dependent methyltransferase [Fuerstiella sp.]
MSELTDHAEVIRHLKRSPELFDRLAKATGKELGIQMKLRKDYPGDVVSAAIALREIRAKVEGKLDHADQLWLTRQAVEQSTAWEIAQYKAKRFPQSEPVLDLCSGIGMDSRALLQRGPVTAIDVDEAMSLRTLWNMQVWATDRTSDFQVLNEDAAAAELAGKWIHADPDRRTKRDLPTKRLEQYCPDLTWMQTAVSEAIGGAIKISPASNFMQKFPGCEIELISLNGECREATVWFGELGSDVSFRATSLPTGETLAANPLDAWCEQADSLGDYLFDPDPALVRSGLLDVFGEQNNLLRLDPEEEYFTGTTCPDSSFVNAFQIEAELPNNLTGLKKYLRKHPASRCDVKCRRLKVDASQLQTKLPRGDGPVKVIFFLRIQGKAKIVVTQRVTT